MRLHNTGYAAGLPYMSPFVRPPRPPCLELVLLEAKEGPPWRPVAPGSCGPVGPQPRAVQRSASLPSKAPPRAPASLLPTLCVRAYVRGWPLPAAAESGVQGPGLPALASLTGLTRLGAGGLKV